MISTFTTGQLPPTFTSLYRLFLRSTASSVLNHRSATRRLRMLWRPTFEGAARVIHALRSDSLVPNERKRLQRWYTTWENRVDNTLTLLCISAQHRGLSHSLTRNMDSLVQSHLRYGRLRGVLWRRFWNPKLDPNSSNYQVRNIGGTRSKNKADMKASRDQLNDGVLAALGEVIMMAEGKSGISLGRIPSMDKMAGYSGGLYRHGASEEAELE